VEREQPQQHLLAEGRIAAAIAYLCKALGDPGVQRRVKDSVADEPRLEEALELWVGSCQLVERPR
jgi:hypothetical protein